MQSIQPRLFYGWVIVAAATAIIATGMGLMDALGVFMEPLETTFGWGRGHIGRASLVCWLVSGLSSFLFGALSDRLGTRVVVLIGGLLFGVGMLVLSHMQTLWHLYLASGVFVGGGTGAFMVPLTATTTRWFTRRRALAVAITNCRPSRCSSISCRRVSGAMRRWAYISA